MAILLEPPADLLTYEAFMADPTVRGRCDIVQGVRVFQPELNWRRQEIIGNFRPAFSGHQRCQSSRSVSSFDVLICRAPLQIRQPDILLISQDRLTLSGGPPKTGSPESGLLESGPELVVEIMMDGQSEETLWQNRGLPRCWCERMLDSTA